MPDTQISPQGISSTVRVRIRHPEIPPFAACTANEVLPIQLVADQNRVSPDVGWSIINFHLIDAERFRRSVIRHPAVIDTVSNEGRLAGPSRFHCDKTIAGSFTLHSDFLPICIHPIQPAIRSTSAKHFISTHNRTAPDAAPSPSSQPRQSV